MNQQTSTKLFARAKELIPGGVNSPVRAFKSVGRDPIFISKAAGSKIYDADGNKILDGMSGLWCVNAGYGRQELVDAAAEQMQALRK